MSKIVYKVVRHDGGWTYEVSGTFSETYRTREAARLAARLGCNGTVVPLPGRVGLDRLGFIDEKLCPPGASPHRAGTRPARLKAAFRQSEPRNHLRS
jgi:hypothetical protein